MKRIAADLGGKAIVLCDVAATPEEQMAGLQVRASLAHGDGMIFPFDPARHSTMHMGTVAYPIDIVFLGKDRRVARIVSAAQPGVKDRWSHSPCAGVVELPGGYAQRVGLAIGDLVQWPHRVAQTYDLLRGLTEGDSTEMDADRFEDHALPDENSPAQTPDDAMPGWSQSFGPDLLDTNYQGPAVRQGQRVPLGSVIVEIVDDMTTEGGVPWKPDELNPASSEKATITAQMLVRWLTEYDDQVKQAVLSEEGLKAIGDGLILAGFAEQAQVRNSNLILWRTNT